MKPNTIGVAGAILNYIACGLAIIVAFALLFPMIVIEQTNWLGQTDSSFSLIMLIFFLLVFLYGLIGIILTVRFQLNAEKKLLIGVLSIIFGLSNLVGIISGILILVSQPRV